jgi:hypothetical protein
MSTMMDIIFATIIGGAVTLITINANIIMSETVATCNGDVMVQSMIISNAQIIECEFRNMGCGVEASSDTVITEALDTSIVFKMRFRPDLNNPVTNPICKIKYYSGPPSELSATSNPLDRFLYRRVDNNAPDCIGMVSQFKLVYFKKDGDSLNTPVPSNLLTSIRIVEITMEVQNPNAIMRDPSTVKAGEQSALYSVSLWKQTRLASQNLNR